MLYHFWTEIGNSNHSGYLLISRADQLRHFFRIFYLYKKNQNDNFNSEILYSIVNCWNHSSQTIKRRRIGKVTESKILTELSNIFIKFIYSEKATKMLRDLHLFLTGTTYSQKKAEISQNFCGLLRIYELYHDGIHR